MNYVKEASLNKDKSIKNVLNDGCYKCGKYIIMSRKCLCRKLSGFNNG